MIIFCHSQQLTFPRGHSGGLGAEGECLYGLSHSAARGLGEGSEHVHLVTAAVLQNAITLADVMLALVAALHQRQRLQTLHTATNNLRVSQRIPALSPILICTITFFPWRVLRVVSPRKANCNRVALPSAINP